jgi:hypothetical protein
LPANVGTYDLSLDARFVSGLPARISVISNVGEQTLATKLISTTSGWSRERLTFQVPPEAKDVYLYLYVYGPDDGTKSVWLFDDPNLRGRTFPRSIVLTGTTPEARQADPLGLNIGPSGPAGQTDVFWIASDWARDPWWQLRLSTGTAVRLPWKFGGFGNIWEVEIPGGASASVTAVYLPDRLFHLLLAPTWLLMMLLLGLSVIREVWISRRELRFDSLCEQQGNSQEPIGVPLGE